MFECLFLSLPLFLFEARPRRHAYCFGRNHTSMRAMSAAHGVHGRDIHREHSSVTLVRDLYDEAARLVVSAGQASISYLQRRLRIGFSRAARLVDMMEADGLVSASNGGKAREVLVGADYFDQVDVQLR